MGKKKTRRRRKQRGGSKKLCSSLFLPRGETWSSIDNTLGTYYGLNHSGGAMSNVSSVATGQMLRDGVLKGGGKNPLTAFLPSHVVDVARGFGGWGKNAINTYNAQPSISTHNVTKGHYLGEFD